MTKQFIEFVGNTWINGKAVAAYRVDADTVQLRAETTGGKIISQTRNVTNDEFDALKEEWRGDDPNHQSAITAERALSHLRCL